jgi:4-amino-4-deoxy-L-arabinose transferase-like glycosyltransferase
MAFQGSRGLFEPTETRYAEVAREMLESGDYLHPTLSHQPHLTKPPVAYWAIAAGMRLLGRNAWGARFGNVIALCLTVLAIASIGTTVWGNRIGFLAGLIYLSSPLPVIGAAAVSTDTLLTLWEVCAVLAYIKAITAPSVRRARWWTVATGLAFALGFLTKGPPALLPLAAIVVFHLRSRRRLPRFSSVTILLSVILGLSWYLMIAVEQRDMIKYFLGEEIFRRNFTTSAQRNPQWYAPFTVFLPTLLLGAGFWLFYALRLHILRGFGTALKRVFTRGVPGLSTLIFLWFVIPLVVFSLSRSRLPLYMVAVYPPVALALATGIRSMNKSARGVVVTSVASIVFILALKFSAAHIPIKEDSRRLYESATEAAGKNAVLVLANEKNLHGLEFYANGRILRISFPKKETWANYSLNEFVKDVRTGREKRYAIVTDPRSAEKIRSVLRADGIEYRESKASVRSILVLGAARR